MNWEAIGAVGEILGAMAVVASLAYLAVQIRSQRKESTILAMHEISEAFRDSISVFSDLAKAEIYVRGNEDFDSLSDAEKFVLIASLQRILRVWEEAYHQHREHRLSDKIWNVMVLQYSAIMSAGSFIRVWELRRDFYDPEFGAFVESLEKIEYRIK